MANIKISNLPVAVSVAGSDSFPVVQSGVTKQATKSVLFASPTFTGTTTASILTATGNVTFDGGTFVFNESGADKDARFEGDGDPNLLFLDASTDRVGIGTSSPGAKLNVVANSSSDAVRITQTGAGNALVVEDSANPDATPFVINAAGDVVIGNTSALASVSYSSASITPSLQVQGTTGSGSASGFFAWRADSTGSQHIFSKSRGATVGTRGLVLSGDNLGVLTFAGDDGTNFIRGALIAAQVDGTPGTNDMPGRLVFSTTADGSASPTERARITSEGDFIHQVNGTAPTLSTNSTMSFELTSNTSLKIVVRGTDGTTRSVSLTLS